MAAKLSFVERATVKQFNKTSIDIMDTDTTIDTTDDANSIATDQGLTMKVSTELAAELVNGDDDDDIGEFVDEEDTDNDDGDVQEVSSEEEEEDIEPMVIYERMRNEITTICSQRDAISCFAVHYKVRTIY